MKKKSILIILIIIVGSTILFFSGRYFIYRKVNSVLADKVDYLKKQGITISYDSLDLNPWSGYLSASNLKVKIGKDDDHLVLQGSATELLIEGIKIIPFLINKSLTIGSISLNDPIIIHSSTFKWPDEEKRNGNSQSKKTGKGLHHLNINYLLFKNASILLNDSIKNDTATSIKMSMTVRDFELNLEKDSIVLQRGEFTITPLEILTPKSFYSYHIQQLHFNLTDKSLLLDTFKIIPIYDRATFMRKAGEQTSRMEALIPNLAMDGLTISGGRQLSIHADRIVTSMKLHVYRDKHYAFMKKTESEMPMEFLQKLPFQINADTIKLKNSFVRYEEFPENGDSTGFVFFENLNSTISHLHNKAIENEDVKMKISALFMGKGKLNANFTFPSDTTKAYTTSGTLKDFPLSEVNAILEPSFKTRIESGTMTDFKFNFIYNKTRSDGDVELNYNELKIISMKKDKDEKKIISKFKTAVINLFILHRNSEKTESGDKKTGTILYYRDRRRAIFHFWWKSIFSGLVTAYKLDGLVPDLKDHGKEISEDTKDKLKKKERAK